MSDVGQVTYLAYLYNERRKPTSRTFDRINDAIMWLHAQLPAGAAVDVRPSKEFIYEIEGDEEGYTIRGYVAANDEADVVTATDNTGEATVLLNTGGKEWQRE